MSTAVEVAERDRHIFARLLDGLSIRDIAEAEGITVRRVQQIVARELVQRDMNPAREYQILQIARLERALELLGAQIDAGHASAVTAFVRVMEMLNRPTADQLQLGAAPFREKGAVAAMQERLDRLSIAREVFAERHAKRSAVQGAEIMGNRETANFAGADISKG